MKTEIDEKTLARIRTISKNSENINNTINRLINVAIGLDCPHTDPAMYMEIAHDTNGYMDMDETLKGLTDIKNGTPTRRIIKVCKACMRGSEIDL